MKIVDTLAQILVNALEHESNQARFVLEAAESTDLAYTPKEDLRPLVDLANHLAQIPLIDFKFYSTEFKDFEEVQALEKELRRDSITKMLEVYDKGIKTLKEKISQMSDEQIMEKNLKAFYEEGEEKNWAFYLPEITTHLAMHKMQLWMYLRLAGAPVSMWTYYGIPKSE